MAKIIDRVDSLIRGKSRSELAWALAEAERKIRRLEDELDQERRRSDARIRRLAGRRVISEECKNSGL